MPLAKKLIYSLALTLIFTLSFGMLKDFRGKLEDDLQGVTLGTQGDTLLNLQKPVKVFASVGGYMINLISGWTSPFAEVSLSAQNLTRKTTAEANGYFEFNSIPVPDNLGEICLISQDVNQLPTFPTCLAPPPRNMNLEIKDILLSPSISLASGAIPVGGTTKASGMTFPKSEVEVYLFTDRKIFLWSVLEYFSLPFFRKQKTDDREPFVGTQGKQIADKTENRNLLNPFFCNPSSVFRLLSSGIVKPVSATGLPIYRIRSNENGYFEFSLPANSPSNNRVFATANFASGTDPRESANNLRKSSPKSNTLSFRALGLLGILGMFLKEFFRQAGLFFANLKNDPLIIILIEISILLGLVGAILARKALQKENPKSE